MRVLSLLVFLTLAACADERAAPPPPTTSISTDAPPAPEAPLDDLPEPYATELARQGPDVIDFPSDPVLRGAAPWACSPSPTANRLFTEEANGQIYRVRYEG